MQLRFIRSPELRGIVGLVLIILVIAFVLAAVSGSLEQWFGITWFSGKRVLDKIVYVSGASEKTSLYTIDPDGTNSRQLTNKVSVVSAPAISPSGRRIVFLGMRNGGVQVFSVGARGGSPRQLTGSELPKDYPAFRPDEKNVSYIAGGRVYEADLRGQGASVVLPTRELEHAAIAQRDKIPSYSQYAWSPTGQSIVAVTQTEDDNDVLVRLPIPDGSAQAFPGPPGARVKIEGISFADAADVLAVSTTIDETSTVLVIDFQKEKSAPVMMSKEGSFGRPALSADARIVAVPVRPVEGEEGGKLVWANAGSGEQKSIEGNFEGAAFSPKGDKILAVQTDKDGKRDIVIIDPETSDLRKLTNDGKVVSAIWSPASE